MTQLGPAQPGPFLREVLMKIVKFEKVDATVVIDYESAAKYKYLVGKMGSNEVQWFSTVDKYIYKKTDKHPKEYCYVVRDIFIPGQVVSAAEVDTDPANDPMSMLRIFGELKKSYRVLDEEGNDAGPDIDKANSIIKKMHVWSHSHPMTSAKPMPSGQDNANFMQWVNRNDKDGIVSPMLMLIFSKGTDKVFARVYDPEISDQYFDDVEVYFDENTDIDMSYIDEAIETKIEKKQFPLTKYNRAGFKTAAAVISQERAAIDMFKKSCPNIEELLNHINSNPYEDSKQQVQEWVEAISKWLKTPKRWNIFTEAAFGKDDDLVLKAISNECDMETVAKKLSAYLEQSVVVPSECRSAMQFAIQMTSTKLSEPSKAISLKRFLANRTVQNTEKMIEYYEISRQSDPVVESDSWDNWDQYQDEYGYTKHLSPA